MIESSVAPPSKANAPFNAADVLLKSRIVMLDKEVRDENANDIVYRMWYLNSLDPKADIYFYINSPGGSVTAGSAIYDTMQLISNDVVTFSFGMAASMGQYLLTGGAPGKRFISPTGRVLLHQPHGGYGGNVSDIIRQSDLINDMKTVLASNTAKRTGKKLEEINAAGDRDAWYNAEEALEFGFVDHILTDFNDIRTLGAKQDGN